MIISRFPRDNNRDTGLLKDLSFFIRLLFIIRRLGNSKITDQPRSQERQYISHVFSVRVFWPETRLKSFML